jgi:hypothetical protein
LSAHGTRDLQDVVKEISDEFETAYDYGKEVALMLEVSKLPYQCQQRSSLFKGWILLFHLFLLCLFQWFSSLFLRHVLKFPFGFFLF